MSTKAKKRAVAAENGEPLSPWLTTGSLGLDLALGGGWPRGRIVEIFGASGSGKTTLLLEAIAHAQRAGGMGAIIDADHGLDAASVGRFGLDLETMPYHRTNGLEEAFEKIEELVRGNSCDVIALDSIAVLLPREHRTCADFPPLKNQSHQLRVDAFLKILLEPLSRSRATLLITNQIREKLGVFFGSPDTIPWETLVLPDYSSQRVEIRRSGQIKKGEKVVGSEQSVKCVKNRLAPPYVTARFEISFATGIRRMSELLGLGLELGLLSKRGAAIYLGERMLGRGQAEAVRTLNHDPDLAAQLRTEIIERRKQLDAIPEDQLE